MTAFPEQNVRPGAEIILIQPYTGDWDEMSVRFPESLLAVAAVPAAKGYAVRIIDQRISRNYKAELAAAVGPATVVFGVTAITGQQIRYALELIRYLKKTYPSVPVCMGGVHATLLPEQSAAHPLIDYVVAGDGDLVFCSLFERLKAGLPVDDLPGVFSKRSGGAVSPAADQESGNGQRQSGPAPAGRFRAGRAPGEVITDLDALPPLPYELIDVSRYNVFYTKEGLKSATLNTSRGCPYRCKFCSDPVINRGTWRGFSARRVLEKVETLHDRYGIRMIYFQDDYFPGPKERFLEILRGLKKYRRTLLWSTLGIRADILSKLTDEEWDLLYESGCHSLEIGIESGNERIIRMINKGETLEEMRTANSRLARYDIKVKYTLIVGFPDENEEEVMDTVRFASHLEEANPHAYCLLFTFLPVVGTPFFEEALKRGFAVPASLEEWANMEFDGWMKKYGNWLSPERIARLESISFVSYFHNRNVKYKLGGSALLRLSFELYHPVAKWRFARRYFDHCFEISLKNWLLKLKYSLRKR